MTNINENNKLITPDTNILFNMKDNIPIKSSISLRDPLTNVWEDNALSNLFFSGENVNHLQNKLIEGVYLKSNKKIQISRQNNDELYIIMKSIYLQYGKKCKSKSYSSKANHIATCGEGNLPTSSWLMSSIAQSKDTTCDNSSQVDVLNQHVLNYAVNQVYNEVLSYLQFKNDLNQVNTPIDHPISTNIQDKQLKHFKSNQGDFLIPQRS